MLLANLSSVAIINKFLHGASHYGWANSPGATGSRKMITSLNGKQAQGAAQVTALLPNKCCKQQSLQRPICQHVYAIKDSNYGDDSQKKCPSGRGK